MVSMLNLWWTCSIYGENAQFMVKMLNLWWTCSIYDESYQFMVNMHKLWWTYSIYGEHAQFIVNMLTLWWICWIYDHWSDLMIRLALLNYPKITLWMIKSVPWIKRYSDIHCDCTITAYLTSWLNLPCKSSPKWLYECQNPSTGSKDTLIFIFKSAELYSHSWFDLMIVLALKN